jgi:hypothetical protein
MKYLLFLLAFAPWAAQAQFSLQPSTSLLIPAEGAGKYYRPCIVSGGSFSWDISSVYLGGYLGRGNMSRKSAGYSITEGSTTLDVTLAERSRSSLFYAFVGTYLVKNEKFDVGAGLQFGGVELGEVTFKIDAPKSDYFGENGTFSTIYSTWGFHTQFRYFIHPNIALTANGAYWLYRGDPYSYTFPSDRHPTQFLYRGTLGQLQIGLTFRARKKQR